MNRIKSLLFVLTVLLSTISISACAEILPYNGYFDGGEILDNELISEIRSKYVVEETTESSTKESHSYYSESYSIHITDTSKPSSEKLDDATVIETETEASPETESTTESASIAPEIVYWTENGEVYHTKETCRYLKNKSYISGSVQQAVEKGKDRICSSCSK